MEAATRNPTNEKLFDRILLLQGIFLSNNPTGSNSTIVIFHPEWLSVSWASTNRHPQNQLIQLLQNAHPGKKARLLVLG
jgi:hypothetical protein